MKNTQDLFKYKHLKFQFILNNTHFNFLAQFLKGENSIIGSVDKIRSNNFCRFGLKIWMNYLNRLVSVFILP